LPSSTNETLSVSARACAVTPLCEPLKQEKVINKLLVCLTGCIVLSACAPQLASAPYRPAYSTSQWLIDGQISPGYEGSFYVNGQLAAKGPLREGIVRGIYNGHPVSVTCKHTKGLFSTDDDCDVFVDQELATRLHFTKNY